MMMCGQALGSLLVASLISAGVCSPTMAETQVAELGQKIAKFSTSLYNEVAKEKAGENIIMSPFSVEVLLALLSLGSEAETHNELLTALALPNDAFTRTTFKGLSDKLKGVKGVTLDIANKIYVKKGGVPLDAGFERDSVEVFNAGIEALNFEDNALSAKTINGWVESKTNNRIKDLLSPDDLDASTRLVLVNALYFKGSWKEKFNEALTRPSDFQTSAGAKVQVPTMYIQSDFHYFQSPELNAQFLQLPYEGDEMSMVFVLPGDADGLPALQAKLATDVNILDVLSNMLKVKVDVKIPKFKIETTIDLINPLKKVGIQRIFREGEAQLSKLTPPERLFVSKAVQKAFIEVNEEGAEAAAATGTNITYQVDNSVVRRECDVSLTDLQQLEFSKNYVDTDSSNNTREDNQESPLTLQKELSRTKHFICLALMNEEETNITQQVDNSVAENECDISLIDLRQFESSTYDVVSNNRLENQESPITLQQELASNSIENIIDYDLTEHSIMSNPPPSSMSVVSCDDFVADPDYPVPISVQGSMETIHIQSPSILPSTPSRIESINYSRDIENETHVNEVPSAFESTASEIPKCSNRKRQKRRCKESWKQNLRKKNRNSGLEYESKKGLKPARKPQMTQCGCKQDCNHILTDDARQKIFDTFWNLGDINRQRDYLIKNVESQEAQRPRVTNSRRKYTLQYNFSYDSVKYRVCKKFFLNTLNITDKIVRTALNKKRRGIGDIASPDKRGRHRPGIGLSDETIQHAVAHINSFPAVPSHWCRRDSKKLYLESTLNKEKMYSLYEETCKKDTIKPVSKTTYRELLIKKNIAFYMPRKDQCWCQNYELLSEDEKLQKKEKYDLHQQRKVLAKAEKQKDTEEAKKNSSYVCGNFDMEAVLYSPKILGKPVFYKRKLATFNFTVFNTAKKLGYCFLWPEFEGGRGANEVATCLSLFIKKLPANVSHLVLYSDCCPGQNRNSILVSMLLTAISANDSCIETIDYKFLEPGHTYMECDSMHAAIERASESAKIYIPDDWENVIKLAKKTQPYNIERLTHKDFIDYKKS